MQEDDEHGKIHRGSERVVSSTTLLYCLQCTKDLQYGFMLFMGVLCESSG